MAVWRAKGESKTSWWRGRESAEGGRAGEKWDGEGRKRDEGRGGREG